MAFAFKYELTFKYLNLTRHKLEKNITKLRRVPRILEDKFRRILVKFNSVLF